MTKGKKAIYWDSFDHDAGVDEQGLRGEKLDMHVLSNSKKVSIFWITETQARANRITAWQKSGVLALDNKKFGYPWLGVVSFNEANTMRRVQANMNEFTRSFNNE